MTTQVQKLSENSFMVEVPVYFTVVFDSEGALASVSSSGGRQWVRGGRNKAGRAYGPSPTGVLLRAATKARAASGRASA